ESGNILQAQNKLTDAVTAYKHAIALTPHYAVALNNLGNTLVKQGKLNAAMHCYQEAIRHMPDLGEAYVNLGWTYKEHGMIEDDIACLKQYLSLRPNDHKAHSDLLFSMNYDPSYSPEQLYSAAKGWWQQHAPKEIIFTHQPRISGQKLRIGFLSPDFRQHPVGTFLTPLFSAIDKQKASLHCYAEMHNQQKDAVSHRLLSIADTWTNTLGLTAAEAAARIHQDRIDILIDLAGHSANNRLDIMALKPAPVQVSWLGYVNTTGLPVIDYRLTDIVTDPPGTEAWHSEKLFRMPDAFFCYEPPVDAPAIGPLPALTQGHITFGSLNNPAKISPQVIA
ncbi:MAG: tetratricopeptide repeat protein, partial [Desulfobulbaceae bacterium]|nr:tetratricopeptide repeat protein [Desulfobulbaceae bacterium]